VWSRDGPQRCVPLPSLRAPRAAHRVASPSSSCEQARSSRRMKGPQHCTVTSSGRMKGAASPALACARGGRQGSGGGMGEGRQRGAGPSLTSTAPLTP